MKNSEEDPNWPKMRSLLKENLVVPPLQNPDFINARVMEAIERSEREPERAPLFSLRWLSFSGASLLAIALLISVFYLPSQFAPRSEGEFISQVIDARAGLPKLSVTQFQAPGERGVVLWLDGVDYIPADAPVR